MLRQFAAGYNGTEYKDSNQPVYVVRYMGETNYEIPYSAQFRGSTNASLPGTRNGFVGSSDCVIPEYTVRKRGNVGTAVSNGMIVKIMPDGTEIPVAGYSIRARAFKLMSVTGDGSD